MKQNRDMLFSFFPNLEVIGRRQDQGGAQNDLNDQTELDMSCMVDLS
jgi:hypothetical protein